jgi:hypothetical protein
VSLLLGLWRSHSDYQKSLVEKLLPVYLSDKNRVSQYATILTKLYWLDLDQIKPLVNEVYSHTGSPAKLQPEIVRSFILMSHLNEPSISNWVAKLKADSLLALMIGVDHDTVPEVGNHYDLMNRLWLANPDSPDQDSIHAFRRKPRKKLAKNEKLPPRHPGIIQKFVDLALQDKSFEHRPERLLQQIFAEVAVKPSAEAGLLGNTSALVIAGDGTCINTGASPYGVKICSCASQGIYNCECPRRYSDSRARWGWDSYHETWFFGYTGYFLSVYNSDLKTDLPVYLRLLDASRFDGVSAIVALAEFRKLYPEFTVDLFLGDSAHDNYATYHLLNAWHIKPIIALNSKNIGKANYPGTMTLNENGVPICLEGIPMIHNGFLKDRCRIKWRCPLTMGKIKSCSHKDQCSPSDYGRTFYTKPEWDLRLFTPIPRGSKEWKAEMKKRTGAERVNKRLLNDYSLEQAKARGKKRWSWRVMIHSINIHLDAMLKVCGFNFLELLDQRLSLAA